MSASGCIAQVGVPLQDASRKLTLALKGCYFDEIARGIKCEEYRLCTPYWERRLVGIAYDWIVLTRGYPKSDDAERRLVIPFRGYLVRTILYPHFGPLPVDVFAILVAPAAERRRS